MLTAGSKDIYNKRDFYQSKKVGISYIRYFGKEKFLFEGAHLKLSMTYRKGSFLLDEDRIHTYEGRESSATIGYGWHYFNHTLLFMLNVGMLDSNSWNNRDFKGGYTRFRGGGMWAFIF